MRIKRLAALAVFLFFPVIAFAQTAAELDVLLEANAVTTRAAALFMLGAAGIAANDAYEEALSRGWVKKGPDEAISLQETAFLMMNALELGGGVMYKVARSPRYAYREMIYRKLILGRTDANMKLTGRRFLQILGRTLDYSGEREQMDTVLRSSAGYNGGIPGAAN